MLKLLEGNKVEVSTGSGMSAKMGLSPSKIIDTSNILFICGGAFSGLDEVIKKRLTKTSTIGFNSSLKDEYDKDDDIYMKATVEDLKEFGMIPEFLAILSISSTKTIPHSVLKTSPPALVRSF